MLDAKIQVALNQQINKELEASYTYLAMAGYFDQQNLTGFSQFMEAQSDEERGHAQRLFRYMLARDGNVELESVKKPQKAYGSIQDAFALALEQEKENTEAIYGLYDLARECHDYGTLSHLQWFLDEQVEEEKAMSDILGRLELAGGNNAALLILDDQVGKLRPPAKDSESTA